MQSNHDVAIIGAGPSGLFAALELAETGLQIVVVDAGKDPQERTSITSGVGGAGTFSDGKLNLSTAIGGDPSTLSCSAGELETWIDHIDRTFSQCGAPAMYSGEDTEALARLRSSASQAGIEFVAGRQRHIGTGSIREAIDVLYHRLIDAGIEFRLETNVRDVVRRKDGFLLKTDDGEIPTHRVLAAPGRVGAYWLRGVARTLNVEPAFGPIDVGVRLEFPAELYDHIERVMYDAKLRVRTPTYDDMVRTFCTNPRGFVVCEDYDEFVLVNGHAENQRQSSNTNVALLTRVELTDPVEDTTKYGRAIAQLASTIGGGRPILQRLKDLQQGRRSTPQRIRRMMIRPTLDEVTAGDVSMALPQRIVVDLLDAIDRLDRIIPGLSSDGTLVYAPEIKFYDTHYHILEGMQTAVPGFYVAGGCVWAFARHRLRGCHRNSRRTAHRCNAVRLDLPRIQGRWVRELMKVAASRFKRSKASVDELDPHQALLRHFDAQLRRSCRVDDGASRLWNRNGNVGRALTSQDPDRHFRCEPSLLVRGESNAAQRPTFDREIERATLRKAAVLKRPLKHVIRRHALFLAESPERVIGEQPDRVHL